MLEREAACMHRYPLLPRSLRRLDRLVQFGLTMLAVMTVAGFMVPGPPERPATQLVHGRCGAHEWLVVADRQQSRISAYDAGDGRPLGVLDLTSGMADVDHLVPEGCWVVVLGDGEPQALHLPELRPHPLVSVLLRGHRPRQYAEIATGPL